MQAPLRYAEVLERGVQLQFFLDDGHEDVDRDGDPDLSLHGVLRGAAKPLYAQTLLDPGGKMKMRFRAIMNARTLLLNVIALALCNLSFAAGETENALVAARQKFFGAENVDSKTGAVKNDKVIFSWGTNTTFVTSILGRVILLDTYVNLPEPKPTGRTPFVVEDLVNVQPEAIFLGHGHFDHADNAAYIAKKLNIPIYASAETCAIMEQDAAYYFEGRSKVQCHSVVSAGSTPGTEIFRIKQLEPLACIVGFKHLHSAPATPHDPTVPLVAVDNIPDPRDPQMYPQTSTCSTSAGCIGGLQYPTAPYIGFAPLVLGFGGPIAIMYQIILRGHNHFTLTWHDTTGAVKEGCALDKCYGTAVGDHLQKIMQSLPRTDVELGSVFDSVTTNGERDIVMYNQNLRSKVFVPTHLDVAVVPSGSPEWRIAWLKENDVMSIPSEKRPEPRWIVDPIDYTRPWVYSPKDARWFDAGKDDATRQYCGEGPPEGRDRE
jgi:L-ascorbate metabolism protein UlaG (beta-lactamase superfamily)